MMPVDKSVALMHIEGSLRDERTPNDELEDIMRKHTTSELQDFVIEGLKEEIIDFGGKLS